MKIKILHNIVILLCNIKKCQIAIFKINYYFNMGQVKKNIELTKEQKEAAKEHRKMANRESQRLYRRKTMTISIEIYNDLIAQKEKIQKYGEKFQSFQKVLEKVCLEKKNLSDENSLLKKENEMLTTIIKNIGVNNNSMCDHSFNNKSL